VKKVEAYKPLFTEQKIQEGPHDALLLATKEKVEAFVKYLAGDAREALQELSALRAKGSVVDMYITGFMDNSAKMKKLQYEMFAGIMKVIGQTVDL
jgi:hypothetical protein